jgi:hypothetical protein
MSRVADMLLTCWIIFVAVVYFAGAFDPRIGDRTAQFGVVYIVMLISCAAYAFLTRRRPDASADGKNVQ